MATTDQTRWTFPLGIRIAPPTTQEKLMAELDERMTIAYDVGCLICL